MPVSYVIHIKSYLCILNGQIYSLGTKRCPVGFFSSEQVVYMAGMTTHFRRPDKISDYGGEDPYESMSGLIPADSKKHVYLLPHTSMKFSTGKSC